MEMLIKLKMVGIWIIGPAKMYFDKKGVFCNMSMLWSAISKKQNSIKYFLIRQTVVLGIGSVAEEDTLTNLAGVFTNLLPYSQKAELMWHILYNC